MERRFLSQYQSLLSELISCYLITGLIQFATEETQRAPSLIARSPTYTETQLMNPLFRAITEQFLTTRSWFWWGNERKESVSKPYVHSSVAMRIGPGGKAQPLHRDDYISHNHHDEISEWDDERDKYRESALGFFVAGNKVTKENGGTQFIPRSHLWYASPKPVLGPSLVLFDQFFWRK